MNQSEVTSARIRQNAGIRVSRMEPSVSGTLTSACAPRSLLNIAHRRGKLVFPPARTAPIAALTDRVKRRDVAYGHVGASARPFASHAAAGCAFRLANATSSSCTRRPKCRCVVQGHNRLEVQKCTRPLNVTCLRATDRGGPERGLLLFAKSCIFLFAFLFSSTSCGQSSGPCVSREGSVCTYAQFHSILVSL